MGSEEADYAEVLRRVREAEDTKASALDLSLIDSLNQLPLDLERLTSLQTLALSVSGWRQLSDLTPQAELFWLQMRLTLMQSGRFPLLVEQASLQTRGLSGWRQLSDLTPLAQIVSSFIPPWGELRPAKFPGVSHFPDHFSGNHRDKFCGLMSTLEQF